MKVRKRVRLDLTEQFAVITKQIQAEANRRVMAAANAIRNEVLLGMKRGPQTGRFYRVPSGPNAGKMYQASAPGEFPAIPTGRLRSSIRIALEHGTKGRVSAVVGTDVLYGKFLEYGTKFMAARPFLQMAKILAQPRIDKILKGKWFKPMNEETPAP